ncbi:MAG: MFS transporter [Oscillospiraceae bacterium]|nr:MFS transporter [Oscillospiraceae bacterium]
MKKTLWTRNFTLLTVASAMGAAGGIAGGFALSFLVYDSTGSTLASALTIAVQLIPSFIMPLFVAPWMDRMPRKPFLVGGDILNGVMYALMGVYLLVADFSYVGYLGYSLLLATLGVFDQLAFNSIYPRLIPEGMEQKGYAVSSMLYPILLAVMMPLAAVLMQYVGVARLLIAQGFLSLCAAAVESGIRIREERLPRKEGSAFRTWLDDIREAAAYIKSERGLRSIYSYMAVTNGLGNGCSPILVAFFRTAPGMTAAMYSLFSAAEFIGRTIGGATQYRFEMAPRKKFGFIFGVYQTYGLMDMCLLWLPYPLMLVNRGVCGFLGNNSATMRQAAVQRYIPERLRARINAFEGMLYMAGVSVFTLLIGALGEVLDYRLCMTVCGAASMAFCWFTIWRGRADVRKLYEYTPAPAAESAPAQ